MKRKSFVNMLTGAEDLKRKDSSLIWNIFSQILLPLILILTFISILYIVQYEVEVKTEKDKNAKLRQRIADYEETDAGLPTMHNERQKAILDVQRQMLIKNFTDIKHEEYSKLHLSRFMIGNDAVADMINMSEGVINDNYFGRFCRQIKAKADEMNVYRDYLFRRIVTITAQTNELKALEVTPLSRAEIDEYRKNRFAAKAKELENFDRTKLAPSNNAYTKDAIEAYTDQLIQDAVELQSKALIRLIEDVTYSKEIAEIGGEIVNEIFVSGAEADVSTSIFQLNEASRQELQASSSNCEMLEETWRILAYRGESR